MPTQYTISTAEPACVAVEEVASITISRCAAAVATGELLKTTSDDGITVWFYSNDDRLVKILDAHDNGDVTGIPADVTAYCGPEVAVCASTGACAECTEDEDES